MRVTHRYAGQSRAGEGTLGFAPDLTRDPTYFVGTLANTVAFREAISVLHSVVTLDLRPQPTDKQAYFRWLDSQKSSLLAEAETERQRDQDRLATLRAELDTLRKTERESLGAYRRAETKYFNWLYKVDRAAWYVLDPVIAVHPDELSFECFSVDESAYGRLGVDLEMFEDISEFQVGVTNIDYSQTLYDAFQQMRSYSRTELRVNPEGFTADIDAGQEVYEAKIDLPDSWLRGFLQVSSAMTLPMARVRLHPMDVHNICATLRKRREVHGPRSLRFRLKPGAPLEVVVEPWNEVLRRNARKEFEEARYERDPLLVARMLVVGRQCLDDALRKF
ncbi:MAG: SWIM zinc finger family protein, partial [Pseudomonadota bacterium]